MIIAMRCVEFLNLLTAQSIASPVPNKSTPITTKSNKSQTTSSLNLIATKGMSSMSPTIASSIDSLFIRAFIPYSIVYRRIFATGLPILRKTWLKRVYMFYFLVCFTVSVFEKSIIILSPLTAHICAFTATEASYYSRLVVTLNAPNHAQSLPHSPLAFAHTNCFDVVRVRLMASGNSN